MLVIMQNLALILFGTERRGVPDLIEGTFVLGPLIVSYERLMIVGVAAVAGLALWAFIRFTSLGKAIRSASQDPDAAQTSGLDIQRLNNVSFGIGAASAGLACGLLLPISPAHPPARLHPVITSISCH